MMSNFKRFISKSNNFEDAVDVLQKFVRAKIILILRDENDTKIGAIFDNGEEWLIGKLHQKYYITFEKTLA